MNDNWIPVSERLPEENKPVWIFVRDYGVRLAQLYQRHIFNGFGDGWWYVDEATQAAY